MDRMVGSHWRALFPQVFLFLGRGTFRFAGGVWKAQRNSVVCLLHRHDSCLHRAHMTFNHPLVSPLFFPVTLCNLGDLCKPIPGD